LSLYASRIILLMRFLSTARLKFLLGTENKTRECRSSRGSVRIRNGNVSDDFPLLKSREISFLPVRRLDFGKEKSSMDEISLFHGIPGYPVIYA
jgi:hypothetical protein